MRFTESENATPRHMDFVPRYRQREIWRLVFAIGVAVLVIGLVLLAPGAAVGGRIGGMIAMVVVITLGVFVVTQKQRSIDTLMATEFQNLLFTQAATLGTSFCLFVRRDGAIVYANDGLRKIFKNFRYADSMALEGLFAEAGVAKNDRERLLNALLSNSSDNLAFPIMGDNGEERNYILTVEPLPRPSGFAVVRGREYRAERTGTQVMPETLRAISADKLNYLLTSSAVAQFITDPYGRLEFVTPALEALLGYAPGEIVDKRLSLRHLLYEVNAKPLGDDFTVMEYHGVALLLKQSSTLVDALLKISLMRDAEGKVIAATGSLLPQPKL